MKQKYFEFVACCRAPHKEIQEKKKEIQEKNKET